MEFPKPQAGCWLTCKRYSNSLAEFPVRMERTALRIFWVKFLLFAEIVTVAGTPAVPEVWLSEIHEGFPVICQLVFSVVIFTGNEATPIWISPSKANTRLSTVSRLFPRTITSSCTSFHGTIRHLRVWFPLKASSGVWAGNPSTLSTCTLYS